MADKNITFVGTVVWFDPRAGFGFLTWKKDGIVQKDMFVHFSDITCEGFKTLKKGQEVAFGIGENKHGRPKATNVVVITN